MSDTRWGRDCRIHCHPETGEWLQVVDSQNREIPPEDWGEFSLYIAAVAAERGVYELPHGSPWGSTP